MTLPLLTPIIAVVMTFSVLFTFTDFQLIYVLTRGGPLNATHLMATLSFQRAIPGGSLGEGRGDRDRDGAVPARRDPRLATSGCSAAPGSRGRRTHERGRAMRAPGRSQARIAPERAARRVVQ